MSTLIIDIRTATLRDATGVAQVHDESWRSAYRGIIPGRELELMIQRRGVEWWERAIGRGNRVLLLAAGNEIAGYASYGKNRTSKLPVQGEIYEIYVRPHFQSVGLGRKLFNACRSELIALGMKGLVVWALSENEPACVFYEAMGGVPGARGSESFGGKSLEKLAFIWS